MERKEFIKKKQQMLKDYIYKSRALNKEYTDSLLEELNERTKPFCDRHCATALFRDIANKAIYCKHHTLCAGMLWDERIKESDLKAIKKLADKIVKICEKYA